MIPELLFLVPVLTPAPFSVLDQEDDVRSCLARTGDLDGDGTPELLVASRFLGCLLYTSPSPRDS